jgi:hypothetical protein
LLWPSREEREQVLWVMGPDLSQLVAACQSSHVFVETPFKSSLVDPGS